MKFAIRLVLAWTVCLLPWICAANEMDDRRALYAEIQRAWQFEEFAKLEKKYADLVAGDVRSASGQMDADQMLAGLDSIARLPETAQGAVRGNNPGKEGYYKFLAEKTGRWQAAFPNSSLAAYTMAAIYIRHGFTYRGTGYARDTDKQQMDKFYEYIEKARGVWAPPGLERNAAWYVGRMRLAKYTGMPDQELALLIDEATDKYPHDYAIYYTASEAVEPKWGGSIEAYEWIANLALKKTRATSGEALYARIYWNISAFESGGDVFKDTLADWKRMKPAFDDLVKQYPSDWNLNFYATFACLARDGATLKQLFKRIGDKLDPMAWDRPEYLARCRRLANDE